MILVADFKFLLFIKFQIQSIKSSFQKMFYFLSFHLLTFKQNKQKIQNTKLLFIILIYSFAQIIIDQEF
jgi:hypothetical protein